MSHSIQEPQGGHELEPRPAWRLELLDYVVLESMQQWNEASAEKLLRHADPHEQATLIYSLLAIIAGELVREGYPLELGFRFGDVSLPAQDLARSDALDCSLGFLRDRGFVVVADAEAPHHELSAEGASALVRAREAADDLSTILIHRAPDELFQLHDMSRRVAPRRPTRAIRSLIQSTVKDFSGRLARDFRLALIDLALRWLLYSDAPRAYRFHSSYGQLARGQSPFGGRSAGYFRRR
jgi:hypothetical protein